jgi:hypothetical protein
VAGDVVKAVRNSRNGTGSRCKGLGGRLHRTYTDVASAYDRAMDDPEGIDAAAKFAMVRARLCDTGLRADGVLAGGGEARVTVNVEQLIVLPTPQTPQQRLEPTVTIDVNPTEER